MKIRGLLRRLTFVFGLMAGSLAQPAALGAESHDDQALPRLTMLETRARRVADIIVIQRLQRIYGYYLDRSDWDMVGPLTKEGTAD